VRQTRYRIGSGLVPFSPCAERFVGEGYRDGMPLAEQIAAMARVDGMRGVALDYPAQFDDSQVGQVRKLYEAHGFELATLELGLYPSRKWKLGTLSSTDPGVRRDALEMSKRGLDIAREMQAWDVLLWPGQDGFDYPFQADYDECWKLLIDGIGEVAAHAPDVRVAIEYKPKEPRAHCFIRNAGILLWLLKKVDLPNVGATIDFGHSMVAGENAAEAAALLAGEGKLFQVHLNDNYRDWDHDLIVGSVHLVETLEFLYYIVKSGYDGWYLMDVFPYREDGHAAIQQCVSNTERLLDIAHNVPQKELKAALGRMDSVATIKMFYENLVRVSGE
jgi:sugar phosphate isomerase/epimerase